MMVTMFSEARIKHIAQLTEVLVDACLNQTPADEQNELARELDALLTNSAVSNTNTFE